MNDSVPDPQRCKAAKRSILQRRSPIVAASVDYFWLDIMRDKC